jgi:tripartite-type tricarboxylate transporter receptor subunit TctC
MDRGTRPSRRALVTVLLALCAGKGVRAQPRFPQRPITLIVPFAPGGIADLTARAVAEPMARTLGHSVVVDNRPSAGSIVASQAVAGARPDGHTLLLMSNSNALSASLFKKLPYDTLTAFAPVSTLGFFDLGVFASVGGRFASLRDALTYARAQPGKLTIGTIAVGSTQHLAAELFKSMAGIDALVVPYKGTPAVVAALRAGDVDLAFEIVAPMLGQVSGGALRTLAVTGDHRMAVLPDVPTVRQSGVAGYGVASWNAIAAPAGTAPEVVEVLNRAVRDAVAESGVRDKLVRLGVRLQAGSPAELQSLLAGEIRRWGDVIRAAKIEPQ